MSALNFRLLQKSSSLRADFSLVDKVYKYLIFIIDTADGYIEEKYENKYLILASTDKNKGVLVNHT